MGFTVGEIRDVVEVDHALECVHDGQDRQKAAFFEGVVMLERQLLSVLNVHQLLSIANQSAKGKAA